MHLCHPTKSLVSSLNASQRVSRRQKSVNGAGAAGGDMGWTPGAAAARSDGPGGWMPPPATDRNGHGDGVWQPGGRDERR